MSTPTGLVAPEHGDDDRREAEPGGAPGGDAVLHAGQLDEPGDPGERPARRDQRRNGSRPGRTSLAVVAVRLPPWARTR